MIFERTEGLLGDISALKNSKVIVFGVGGVGGYTCEILTRCGVGEIVFCDGDVVEESNVNRQIVALKSTVGKFKAEIMRERAQDINPDGIFRAENRYFTAENAETFDLKRYDYIADCIDDVKAKTILAKAAEDNGIKIISCMGTGNKLDPTALKISDIYETKICPLCKAMRSSLRKAGVKQLKTVYSEEEPLIKTATPMSVAFVPAAAGILMASAIVKELMATK